MDVGSLAATTSGCFWSSTVLALEGFCRRIFSRLAKGYSIARATKTATKYEMDTKEAK